MVVLADPSARDRAVSRRRKPIPTRALRMAMMRDLPVGDVFVFDVPDGRTLYIREKGEMVRCLVTFRGEVLPPDTSSIFRINGSELMDTGLVVHLSPEEQAQRHMLAVHGQGAKAIEP